MDVTLTELTGGYAARQLPTSRTSAETPAQPQAEAVADEGGRADSGDSIRLSAAAESTLAGQAADDEGTEPGADGGEDGNPESKGDKKADADPGAARGADGKPLDETEQREVERLEKRDQEVRTHEQAHQSAGGPHAGSPSYEYETGPDGKQYATSGEVPIDTAAVAGDPAATIAKMEQVKRAALAPAEPSSADRAIAAKADQAKLKAQQELREQQAQGAGPTDGPPPPGQPVPSTGLPGPGAPTGAEDENAAAPADYSGRGALLSLSA